MESKFTPLLLTNYVPSNDEIKEIHNLIIDPINQITQVNAEIARLHGIIDQLSLKRTELHIYVSGHEALITPMRRLPQELLQEIFVHCLPTHHNPVMSCREAPLLLGRVCSQWRTVSRSTPRLWSSIHITVVVDVPPWTGHEWQTPIEDEDGSHYIEEVQAWLNRSGGLPLSISLFYPPPSHPTEFEKRLVLILMEFSHRWKNISLFASSTSISLLSSLSHETVPHLESLVLHTFMNHSPTSGIQSFDIFLAPRLQKVSASHMKMIPDKLGWSQLTSLALEGRGRGNEELTPVSALDILRNSPNLVYCTLEFGWGTAPPSNHESDTIVTMPVLESLVIDEGGTYLNSFFEHLRLPSIINLEFASANRPSVSSIETPIRPSICVLLARLDSLREFTLSANNILGTTLRECLKYTPYITRLSILHPPSFDWHGGWPPVNNVFDVFDDVVIDVLTPPTGTVNRQLLCPHLKIIECNPCNVSDAALLAFIEQRTINALVHNVQHLEKVDIKFRRPQRLDIRSNLPPSILVKTQITLDYHRPYILHRNPSPRAGLEDRHSLEMPTTTSKFFHHPRRGNSMRRAFGPF
ncbi:hypothetical protein BDZ94DRAFT_1260495 [Collybia nuda]|uniref:F-box domain-containing protein n=1 Tax=Collybia nuda TaxID=64659 RepID=A0A9P5Y4S1_9AGAR|nr:hypothetical protein BDZ94DRAFT_1260495 [Collybia nuda]